MHFQPNVQFLLCERTNIIQPILCKEKETPAILKWSLVELHTRFNQIKDLNEAEGIFKTHKKRKTTREEDDTVEKLQDALSDLKWVDAMNVEMEALNKNATWELVPSLKGKKLDFKNAFLHGDLKEEIYMNPLPGIPVNSKEGVVCKLRKTLYGLKQSPIAWFGRFAASMKKFGYVQCHKCKLTALIIYVDDIIATRDDQAEMKNLLKYLVRGLHLIAMGMVTPSSAQGDDKYAASSWNQKRAKIGVRHLIVRGMDFSGKHSFCIEDFVDKTEETSLEGLRGQSWSPLLVSWGFGSRKLEVVVGVLAGSIMMPTILNSMGGTLSYPGILFLLKGFNEADVNMLVLVMFLSV
ncbi:hypothetical protein Prudu_118S000500 [Prunus dulcis]|uniref:Reverse transcriptase Ty1/copia-type domain-containing protein n=1 Tax=Prunus dulcis TaxID=3755 RepID=A0A5H2XXH3_PRUDU|nr:hypothetical protein Prudu_118S000500 [Prunus dulcis]